MMGRNWAKLLIRALALSLLLGVTTSCDFHCASSHCGFDLALKPLPFFGFGTLLLDVFQNPFLPIAPHVNATGGTDGVLDFTLFPQVLDLRGGNITGILPGGFSCPEYFAGLGTHLGVALDSNPMFHLPNGSEFHNFSLISLANCSISTIARGQLGGFFNTVRDPTFSGFVDLHCCHL